MSDRPGDIAAQRYGAYRRGHRDEWLAALALMLKGYRIVARRWRDDVALRIAEVLEA